MTHPVVTVIVPVYKAESSLKRCLDSILMQSFRNWECIVVDDGSPDNSGLICDEYAQRDKRFVVVHKGNGGVSSARNNALSLVRTEWVTFVDADDCISDNYLSIVQDRSEDLLITSYSRSDGVAASYIQDAVLTEAMLPQFFETNLCRLQMRTPWSKFFKSKLVNSITFNQKLRLGEDTLFCLNYYKKCKSICVDNSYVYHYEVCDVKLKYSLSLDEVLVTFQLLSSSYCSLKINSKKFNEFLFIFFRNFLVDRKDDLLRYYSCPIVKDFYFSKVATSILDFKYYKFHMKHFFLCVYAYMSKLNCYD